MSEAGQPENNGKKQIDEDVLKDIDTEKETEVAPIQAGMREHIRKLLTNMKQTGPKPRQELAKDRTRSLALLIGGTVAAVLLFIGVFSTPTIPSRETSGRSVPNLGRGNTPNASNQSRSSVTPLLNADIATNDANSDQVSAADIQGTSKETSSSGAGNSTDIRTARGSRGPNLAPRNADGASASLNDGSSGS
jgi:hypothetical protein